MPHPRILQVLNMTPAEWGKLPLGDERTILTRKALKIIEEKGWGEVDRMSPEQKMVAIEEARLQAKEDGDRLTRAGFEDAMVHQAKSFGQAIELLRAELKSQRDELEICKKALAELKPPAPEKEAEKA